VPWQTPLVSALDDACPGSAGAAFFDLDKTVIAKASVVAFSRPFYREGLLTRRVVARGLWGQMVFLRFGAHAQALERLRLRMLATTEGWEEERVRSIVAQTLIQVLAPITYKEAVDLIAEHKAAGRSVYIVSAAPREIVAPMALYLGAKDAIASEARVVAGRYTGQMLRYEFGPQKAETIREIAERDGIDLQDSWAYSDSATDVPMLEVVGHPVAVNPDRALRRIAEMRGWPVARFTQLAVVTPNGHRPVRRGLVAGAAALTIGALLVVTTAVVSHRQAGARAVRLARAIRLERAVRLARESVATRPAAPTGWQRSVGAVRRPEASWPRGNRLQRLARGTAAF